MADMTHPLDTFDGPDARADAEAAAEDLRGFARSQGYDLEVRTVKSEPHRYGGRVFTRATWGVFLAPLRTPESAPAARRQAQG